MRRILFILVFLITAGAVLGIGACFWGYQQYVGQGPLLKETFFIVEEGQNVSRIASRLADESIIIEPLFFRVAARLTRTDTKLQAGEYRFDPGASIRDVLDALAGGAIYHRRFTVPEGLTSWQVVEILNETEGLAGEIKDIPKEGSLLPETYNFAHGETKQKKIEQMQQAMAETLNTLWRDRPNDAPVLNKGEVVILASIVEKETGVAGERRRIAGVFINRLKKGMKLQTDPTVIYAITGGEIQDEGKGPLGRRLLTKDLQYESPYNTYKYPGLPPGPIANPGRASIEAVLNPEEHGYYYFVADGTGGHVFSKTLEEHNRNVANWRKIRRAQQ